MNDHTIALVKESFDLVEPIAPQAAAMFYSNLFEAEPSIQRLFKSDPSAQSHKQMQIFALVISQLDQPEQLAETLQSLGRRLAGYGVRDEHYDAAGNAILKTLYQGLGVAYTPEVEEAWVDVYGVLVDAMKEAGWADSQISGFTPTSAFATLGS